MSSDELFHRAICEIVKKDPRYSVDAYHFVQAAVTYTAERLQRHENGRSQHISGRELLLGIKDYTREQFGPMAIDVLANWGVSATEHFGHIVFNMVARQLLGASEDDRIENFVDVYTFEDAFVKDYSPTGQTVIVKPID